MLVIRVVFKALFLLVFAAIAFSAAYYYKLDVNAQKSLLRDMNIAIEQKQLPENFYRNIKSVSTEIPDKLAENIELISEFDFEKALSSHEQLSVSTILCPKTETTTIEKAESQSVYFWVDDDGRKHFSDKKPEDVSVASEDFSHRYKKGVDYFVLDVNAENARLEPFAEDRIRADVTQIYHILSQGLNVKDLRKVSLNIRLFDDQKEFQVYRDEVAPGLETNSGFFSGKLNEAAVFQWPERFDVTLSVIRHESSHVILAGLFGITPVWFNEGLAEYFERLEVSAQQKKITASNHKLSLLKDLQHDNELPSLASLFKIDSAVFYSADSLELNYAMAWSFMHFMLSSNQTKSVFDAITNQLHHQPCSKINVVEVANKVYPGGFSSLENAYYQWLNQQPKAHYY